MVKQGRYSRCVLFWILLTQQVLCLILYRGKELISFFFLSFFLLFHCFCFFCFVFERSIQERCSVTFISSPNFEIKFFQRSSSISHGIIRSLLILEYWPGIEYSRISHFQTLNTWRKLKLQIAPGPYKGLTAPHGSHLCWERFWLVGYVQSYLHFSHPD